MCSTMATCASWFHYHKGKRDETILMATIENFGKDSWLVGYHYQAGADTHTHTHTHTHNMTQINTK